MKGNVPENIPEALTEAHRGLRKKAGLLDDLVEEDYGQEELTQEEKWNQRYETTILNQLDAEDRAALFETIMEAGGIQTGTLREEYRGIPNTFKRVDGLPGDEMAEYLATYYPEFGVQDERDLIDVFTNKYAWWKGAEIFDENYRDFGDREEIFVISPSGQIEFEDGSEFLHREMSNNMFYSGIDSDNPVGWCRGIKNVDAENGEAYFRAYPLDTEDVSGIHENLIEVDQIELTPTVAKVIAEELQTFLSQFANKPLVELDVEVEFANFASYGAQETLDALNNFSGQVAPVVSEDPEQLTLFSWWKGAGQYAPPPDQGMGEYGDHQTILDANAGENLEGLPGAVNVPGAGRLQFNAHGELQNMAAEYMNQAGMEYDPPRDYVQVNPENAAMIAQEYEQMPHAPDDPQVAAAYNALAQETLDQYNHIVESGYTFEFYPVGSNPYPNSPREAVLDLHNNQRMYVYPTDDGFGSAEAEEFPNHPLLADSDLVWNQQQQDGSVVQKPVTYNDLFRAVHDFYGHAKEGLGFRAHGEDNAYRQHSAMYSPLAQQALASETRGQNSWVNYHPEHGEQNQTATTADTIFAPQKAGLLPEWVADPHLHRNDQVTSSWWSKYDISS